MTTDNTPLTLPRRDEMDAGQTPFTVNLRHDSIEPGALARIAEAIAREHRVIPVRLDGEHLVVAAARPSESLQLYLTQVTGHTVALVEATHGDVTWAIDSNYQAIGNVLEQVRLFESMDGARRAATASAAIEGMDENAPIVQIVDSILTQALRDRASDVHVELASTGVRIRERIDGTLKNMIELPAAMGPGLINRVKIMASMNIVERRRAQDGQFVATIDDKEVDVRVATASTVMGENCVMRLLDKTRSVLSVNELGMSNETHETYASLVRSPVGMVVIAGPTGSGKTTTLYATIGEVSSDEINVITIEDPVEYLLPAINQMQINEQAGLTFATGLKSILRLDPDVILVGEVRDVETTRIAVQSALTGHLVVASVHATDAVAALHRFLDMGIEAFLVASSVLAIVGQRLVRRICPSCVTTYTPTDAEMMFYTASGGPAKEAFYRGAGCRFCSGTGFKDRIGVYELLTITPEIRRLVVGSPTEEDLRAQAIAQGMRTLRQEAIDLVARDVTTLAEVMKGVPA
jgi:type IV pilus assembly protein PilB